MVAGKAAGLATQVALGWFLTQEEFGLFALVTSLTVTVAVLRNGGTQQILIQKGDEYERLAPVVLRFSTFFNLLSFLILCIVGFVAARIFQQASIAWLVLLLGAAMLLSTPGLILAARIAIDQRFRELAIAVTGAGLARQALMIGLAMTGFGVFSFVIPAAIEPLIFAAICFFILRAWPPSRKVSIAEYRELFKDCRWIMLANLALALRQNGQFLAISVFEERYALGIYFFATQIVTGIGAIFARSINEVVFPGLSNIRADTARHERAFIDGMKLSLATAAMISIFLYLFAQPLISFAWAGKWDQAIYSTEILAFTVTFVIVNALCFAALASQGRWTSRLVLLFVLALGDVGIAGLAAHLGDIDTVALCVTVYRGLATLGILAIAAAKLGFVLQRVMVELLIIAAPAVLVVLATQVAPALGFESTAATKILLCVLLISSYLLMMKFRLLPSIIRRN